MNENTQKAIAEIQAVCAKYNVMLQPNLTVQVVDVVAPTKETIAVDPKTVTESK